MKRAERKGQARPGTVDLLFLSKRELGDFCEASLTTVAERTDVSICKRIPSERHTHGIGLLHVPTVVLYCVLMSGRRGKFQKEEKKKTTKTRPFFLHDMSRVVIVR